MTCEVCGKPGARIRRTTRSFGAGRTAFLIEGVPLVRCPSCRESYLTADTLKEIERIRKHWRKMTVAKRVPVAKFKGAA
jgi:YgiT-type zinc finger domain-containing protein